MPISVPFLNGHRELSIILAEPVVLLRGPPSDPSTHVLRGEVELVISKPLAASQVIVNLVGKSHMFLPERTGALSNKLYYEKTILDENIVLDKRPQDQQILLPGLHRWNFEFLISNQTTETIEDDMAQVSYHVTATVHRPGLHVPNLKCRKNVLLLRTFSCSNDALTSHSLPTTSITSERKTDVCDATLYIEKSVASSGTQFPISIIISPRIKHLILDSIDIILTEKRVYQIPEYGATRAELHDYKLSLVSVSNMTDPEQLQQVMIPPSDISLEQIRRSLTVKNAQIQLDSNPFQYKFLFTLPNCLSINHSTYSKEISFLHYLNINVTLSTPIPDSDLPSASSNKKRCHIRLETPITILDCRLKDDYTTLPTYQQSLSDMAVDYTEEEDDVLLKKRHGFFMCPCYIEYKKKRKSLEKEWGLIQLNNAPLISDSGNEPDFPPPPYSKLVSKP